MRPPRRQTQPFIPRWTVGYASATTLLVALSIGAYTAQLLVQYGLAANDGSLLLWKWLALDLRSLQAGQFWKLFTYQFLHDANPFHLVGNMLLLYFAGREVEPIIGSRHFLAIYGLGSLLGGVASCLAMPGFPVVGTSPAVTAIVLAFTTILPELEVTVNLFFVLPIRLRAKYLAAAVLAMSVVLWVTLTSPTIGPAGMLVAGVFAWLYVKQLGFGNPLAIQRYIFRRRQRAARLGRMSAEQFISAEIDPILDKIAREGMHSLNRSERKILEQGREKIAHKTALK